MYRTDKADPTTTASTTASATPSTAAPHPGRRAVLGLGAAAALVAALPGAAHASASGATGAAGISGRFGDLEREHSARLGIFAHDTGSGRTLAYRADERFPLCSVFKALAVSAVLRDLDQAGEYLAERIHYTKDYVTASGYAPITGTDEHVAGGMTVEELCAAALSHSDNGAANLLMRELGGPAAVTRFARSLGDATTRLDRWEPELNSAEPWRTTDLTSPRAIGRTFARLVLGRALPPADRTRLTGWMIANTTNTERFRAGLPADWVLADKTGGGQAYGVANDVGIVWPPGRAPLVLAVLSTKHASEGPSDNPLVARAAELVAAELT